MAPQGDFIQICFVVEDLTSAMARYSDFFAAGPWFVTKWWEPEDDPTLYRGVRTPLGTQTALAYGGDMMFELVSPMRGSRSIFTEHVARRGYSLHHYGFGVTDFEGCVHEACTAGAPILMSSRTPRGTRVAMIDGAPELGALKEFIEITPVTREFYGFMRKQAALWDRSELTFSGSLPHFD